MWSFFSKLLMTFFFWNYREILPRKDKIWLGTLRRTISLFVRRDFGLFIVITTISRANYITATWISSLFLSFYFIFIFIFSKPPGVGVASQKVSSFFYGPSDYHKKKWHLNCNLFQCYTWKYLIKKILYYNADPQIMQNCVLIL